MHRRRVACVCEVWHIFGATADSPPSPHTLLRRGPAPACPSRPPPAQRSRIRHGCLITARLTCVPRCRGGARRAVVQRGARRIYQRAAGARQRVEGYRGAGGDPDRRPDSDACAEVLPEAQQGAWRPVGVAWRAARAWRRPKQPGGGGKGWPAAVHLSHNASATWPRAFVSSLSAASRTRWGTFAGATPRRSTA